jgi:predicted nucleic acid-binding protein
MNRPAVIFLRLLLHGVVGALRLPVRKCGPSEVIAAHPETRYDAEFVALTQLQADIFITSDGDLSRAVSGFVETAPIDALHTA